MSTLFKPRAHQFRMNHKIDQLIINSPFEEPAEHWSYDRPSRLFTREVGRRPAGYLIASPDFQGFDDPGCSSNCR